MSKSSITIVGHVGRDPEVKTTNSGQAVVSFSVGVGDGFGDKKTTTWYSISAWDRLVESIPKYAKKGSLVMVSGAFKLREYTDTASGQKRYSPEITAFAVERLDTRAEGATGEAPARTAAKPATRTAPPATQRAAAPADDTTITDDDIPW